MIDFVFVHFHAIDWLKAQARVFQICNPERNYRIIVADGTGTDEERNQLVKLKEQGFIDSLVFYKAIERDLARGIDGSAQHAQGINMAFPEVKSDIFCVQDSDFLFVAKEFCNIARRILSNPRIVMFGPTHQFLCAAPLRARLKLELRNLVAPLIGKPVRCTWKFPTFLGGFCKTRIVRDNNLSFDYDPEVFRRTGYDVAYQVNQYIERHHRRDYVALRPQPMEEYRRGYMCAYLYRFRGGDFGMHFLSGASSRDSFKSDELYQQTLAMKKRFMEDALSRARTSKGVLGL